MQGSLSDCTFSKISHHLVAAAVTTFCISGQNGPLSWLNCINPCAMKSYSMAIEVSGCPSIDSKAFGVLCEPHSENPLVPKRQQYHLCNRLSSRTGKILCSLLCKTRALGLFLLFKITKTPSAVIVKARE